MNYYKRHLGDYAKHTTNLNTYEHGVYNRVLDFYYTKEEPISTADAIDICAPAGAKEMASVEKVLRVCFKKDGDLWRHNYADRVIAEAAEKAEKNRVNGPRGGRPPNSRKANVPHGTEPSGLKTETIMVSEIEKSETMMGAKNNLSHKPLANSQEESKDLAAPDGSPKKNSRGSRLPADWTLTPQLETEGFNARSTAGLPEIDLRAEAEKFRDYWTAKAGAGGCKLDWEATWRNWCRNAKGVSNGNGNNGQHRGTRRTLADGIAEAERYASSLPRGAGGNPVL